MSSQRLLPASAAAFTPRSPVTIVLGREVEPWLTQTLKRINRVRRPLNNVQQHTRCLEETLSSSNAIWTLTSLMLPEAPDSELQNDPSSGKAVSTYQLIHVKAYIVHVDMVLMNEVSYKITPDSIESLIHYHKIHYIHTKAGTYNQLERDQQREEFHKDFVQAINKYVYRTAVSALEGLEEEGAGELLCGRSEEVKNIIMGLMNPRRHQLPPSPPASAICPQTTSTPPATVELRHERPSSPNSTDTWANTGINDCTPSNSPFSQPENLSFDLSYSTDVDGGTFPAAQWFWTSGCSIAEARWTDFKGDGMLRDDEETTP